MHEWKRKHHVAFVVLLLFIFIPSTRYLIRAFEVDEFEAGLLIVERDGLAAALEYWREASRRGDLSGFVGEVHGALQNGPLNEEEFKEAFRLAEYASQEAEGITKARALYLVGLLSQRLNNCRSVAAAFGGALKEYGQAGSEVGVFKSRVQLVEAYLACDRLRDASGLYRVTVDEMPQGTDSSRLFTVGSMVAWRTGERQKAIGLADKALETASPDLALMLWASLGRMHALVGNFDLAKDFTDRAFEINQSVYVTINYIAISLCQGGDGEPWLSEVKAEIEKNQDNYLADLLKEIKDQCQ